MISILLPSRNRPDNIIRLFDSIADTCSDLNQIEIIVRLDIDDPSLARYKELDLPIHFIYGDRTVLSEYWNECWKESKGELLMHAGDDIVFQTPDWDLMVKEEFAKYPDNILFVHGDDCGGNGSGFGTHGIIHKDWANTVGYFVPPYFSSDYNDTWLNDVANLLERRRFVDFKTEHMHPAFNKGPMDITHQERLERHRNDNVDALYENKKPEREQDANKLREVIHNFGK